MTLGQFREKTEKLQDDYQIYFSVNGEDGIRWPEITAGMFIREMDEEDEKPKAIIFV